MEKGEQFCFDTGLPNPRESSRLVYDAQETGDWGSSREQRAEEKRVTGESQGGERMERAQEMDSSS